MTSAPPTGGGYPLRGDDLVGVASVFNAEYEVLRGEIGRYQDHHKQIMNFAFVILAAMFALVGGVLGSDEVKPDELAPLMFVFPPVFLLLACLYSDRTVRILRLADYVHNYLRPRAQRITGEPVWEWETYKRQTRSVNRRLALALDKSRWLVFVLPGVACLVTYVLISDHPFGDVGRVAGAITGVLSILGSVGAMFIAEETTGVGQRIVAPGASSIDETAVEDAVELARRIRAAGGRVVVAGGAFDLLHAGHVALLAKAREQGDCLIALINSDESVRQLKGEGRPIHGQEHRAAMLRALESVDAVVVFDETSPVNALGDLRPHLFVKGGDYVNVPIEETELLGEWGGKLLTLPRVGGLSTTNTISKIRGD